MINQIDKPQATGSKKTIAGIIILAIGLLFLLKQFSLVTVPVGAVIWPLGLIGFGIYTGFKHNFKKLMWIVYIAIGVIFLLPNIIPAFNIYLLWPLGMVGFGLFMLLRRNQRWNGGNWEKVDNNKYKNNTGNSIE